MLESHASYWNKKAATGSEGKSDLAVTGFIVAAPGRFERGRHRGLRKGATLEADSPIRSPRFVCGCDRPRTRPVLRELVVGWIQRQVRGRAGAKQGRSCS